MSRKYLGAHEVHIPIDSILQEYAAWSDEIVKAVGDELLKETRRQARTVFTDRSGKLRKSIKKKRSRFDKNSVLVGAFIPHAHLVEHGHKLKVGKGGRVVGHVPAHPFLGPAADVVRDRLPEIINKAVGPLTIEVKS